MLSRRTIAIIAGGVVLATAGVIGAIAATTGPDAPLSSANSPAPRDTGSSTPTPTPSPSTTTAPGEEAPVPEVDPFFGEPVVAVGSGDTPAANDDGLAVRIVSVDDTTVTGEGIGATSGPGLVVVISVTNNGSANLSFESAAVNAYAGEERAPLTAADVDGASALSGSLAPGASATATYGFSVDATPSVVWLTLSAGAGSGLLVLEHR